VRRSLRYLGKLIAACLLFTSLAVGGCLCTLVLLPLLAAFPGGKERRRRRVGRIIRGYFRLVMAGLDHAGIMRVEALGLPSREALAGAIILANHPSYLDIVVLLALLPDTACVVKEAVWNNLVFGAIVRMAGFIPVRDPEQVLADAGTILKAGRALVIFPEGTRTRPGRPQRFHRGAAHLALRTGAPVLPLAIAWNPPLMVKGIGWYVIPDPKTTCRVAFGAAIHWQPAAAGPAAPGLHARELTRIFEHHYLEATSR